jgi:hypothetical protein
MQRFFYTNKEYDQEYKYNSIDKTTGKRKLTIGRYDPNSEYRYFGIHKLITTALQYHQDEELKFLPAQDDQYKPTHILNLITDVNMACILADSRRFDLLKNYPKANKIIEDSKEYLYGTLKISDNPKEDEIQKIENIKLFLAHGASNIIDNIDQNKIQLNLRQKFLLNNDYHAPNKELINYPELGYDLQTKLINLKNEDTIEWLRQNHFLLEFPKEHTLDCIPLLKKIDTKKLSDENKSLLSTAIELHTKRIRKDITEKLKNTRTKEK